MRLFAKQNKKTEKPLPVVDDPVLGLMEWSEGDSGWIGVHHGVLFALSFDGRSAPATDLLVYAKDVLSNATWLCDALEEEKKRLLALDVRPEVRSELAALRLNRLYFSIHQGEGRIFATVDGGGDLRAWRIEYHGRNFDGLSFDS